MDSFDDGCFYYIKLLLMIGYYMNIQFKIYIYIIIYYLFINVNPNTFLKTFQTFQHHSS